jgi:hypothetical protein
MSRPPLSVVGWTKNSGRLHEVAEALGGEARIIFPFAQLPSGAAVKILRYLASFLITASYLARRRPRAVMVVSPPVPALVAPTIYGMLTGATVIIDSHPGGFGAQGDKLSAKLQPLHRWAARRAAAVTVSMSDWAKVVNDWGGRGLLLHEAPAEWTEEVTVPARPTGRPRVLWIGIFIRDEPVELLLELAATMPEIDVLITGDPAKAPAAFRAADCPSNITLLGYLDQPEYRAAILSAHVVIVMTTDDTSVMRSAYEAVYAMRPLVVTDFSVLREFFPDAVFSANEGAALVVAVRSALTDWDALVARAPGARQRQVSLWESQLGDLRALLPAASSLNLDVSRPQRKQT